jgi:hypothetical protein
MDLAFLTLVVGHDRDVSEESRIRIFQGQRLDLIVTVRNLLQVIGFRPPPAIRKDRDEVVGE